MRIAIGCDEAGFELKEVLVAYVSKKGHYMKDIGVHSKDPILYPDIAVAVAKSIVHKDCERGILICGTGIGMAITANKIKGIRAAVCHDPYSAERARKSNDAQIIALGARVIGVEVAKYLIDIWLNSEFQGGSSLKKVERINYYEETI